MSSHLGIVQWQRIFGGRPAGRVGRWLVGVREQVGQGNVFVNFIAANYFLNTYVVFGTVATLPQARRRAFAGALIGDLASFIIDLAAILGLSALIGGSRATLTLAITGATLAFALQTAPRATAPVPTPPLLTAPAPKETGGRIARPPSLLSPIA
ncbi:MAG: hypothetical protein U0232_23615 [Thermomicrobiales bacterium]